MKQSRYIEEVNRLLARLEGHQEENDRQEPETPIPDTQEPIEDIYVLILREWEEEEDEQDIVDSVLTEANRSGFF